MSGALSNVILSLSPVTLAKDFRSDSNSLIFSSLIFCSVLFRLALSFWDLYINKSVLLVLRAFCKDSISTAYWSNRARSEIPSLVKSLISTSNEAVSCNAKTLDVFCACRASWLAIVIALVMLWIPVSFSITAPRSLGLDETIWSTCFCWINTAVRNPFSSIFNICLMNFSPEEIAGPARWRNSSSSDFTERP